MAHATDIAIRGPRNIRILTWARLGWITLLLLFLTFILSPLLQATQVGDTLIFSHYANLIWQGAIPYTDFNFEFPPAVLPFIVLAKPIGRVLTDYAGGFAFLSGLAFLPILYYLHKQAKHREIVLVILVLPILSLTFLELDIFYSAALFWSLVALSFKRFKLSAFLLALAVLSKGYPLICLPIILAFVSPKKIKIYLLSLAGWLFGIMLPLLALYPQGLWWTLNYQISRPINIESGPAAIGFVIHGFGGQLNSFLIPPSYVVEFSGASVVNFIATLCMLVSTTFLVVWARRTNPGKYLVLKCLAVLLVFLIFFKIGNPNFLIPIVFLATLALKELPKKFRSSLLLRIMAINLVICATLLNHDYLIQLRPPALGLVVLRYILLAELLVWIIRQIKGPVSKVKGAAAVN